MYKALIFKELRETIGIGILALLAYLICIANLMGFAILPWSISQQLTEIPFIDGHIWGWAWISAAFATALGLWQTVAESNRGTWLFLLHRPMNLKQLLVVKLAVGLVLYFVISAMAILIYAAWAATPGTHASPFFWWMTIPVWKLWFIMTLGYLGGFLAGIRPGRWIGTRLLPIAAAGILAALIGSVVIELRWCFWGYTAFVIVSAIYVGLIIFVAQTRDYS